MKQYNIICPEIVPMENKGEVAIILGMADTIFPDGNCQFHVFDWSVEKKETQHNIVIHPAKYLFSKWRSQEFRIGYSYVEIYAAFSSILRNVLNRLFPLWIKYPHKEARTLKRHLKQNSKYYDGFLNINEIDYIIAGHNGGLDEYVCHLLDTYCEMESRFSIFGSSMKPRVTNKSIIALFYNTLSKSDFIITRDTFAFHWAKKHFSNLNIEIAPDPAFGMKPASFEEVDEYLKTKNLLDFFSKPVIVLTTAEPTPISRHSFNSIKNPSEKISAHRNLLANLVIHISNKKKYNLLFLPHTLGRDIEIAKDVIKLSQLERNSSIMILEDNISARMLKGIIGRANFLIAERIHSAIGALGVETPFLCLGSKHDLRVKGIIEKMMECGEQVYWLNYPSPQAIVEKFETTIMNYDLIKKHLHEKNIEFSQILKEKGRAIREQIMTINKK